MKDYGNNVQFFGCKADLRSLSSHYFDPCFTWVDDDKAQATKEIFLHYCYILILDLD